MRIAHVVYSCVPERFRGGVPKAAFGMARAQAALGHQVTIYTTTFNSYERTEIRPGSERTVDGVRIRYHNSTGTSTFASPQLEIALREAIPRLDVVHGHSTFLELNRTARRATAGRVPLFLHVHGALDPIAIARGGLISRLRKEVYIRLFERPNLNAAAGVFALTPIEALQLVKWKVQSPVHVVPNGVEPIGVDVAAATEFRRLHDISVDAPIIGYVGRVVPKKALHLLLEAFAIVRRKLPSAVLALGGDRTQDPSYTAQLDAIVDREALDGSVRWLGFVDEMAKRAMLSAAAVFSHATQSEGMALAPLEAMSAGIPTVVSRECYMGDAVAAEAVREVPLDAKGIADALVSLLECPKEARALGARGRAHVESFHAWSAIGRSLVDHYSSALKNQRSYEAAPE
jgi:glycosyltransferase involved in cell wall biosynthesis